MHLAMAAVELTAGPLAPHRHLDRHVLVDVLWACTEPADQPQHVSVRTSPGRADLVLYALADSAAAARSAALRSARRALATSPLLSGWTAREIRLDHLDPFGTPDLEKPE
ncbi:hypothetical protein ABZ128_21065 [Streptomyces sp. NPDC006326]|uniref:hypothetical protein n=1 Tax=Streptomyces sp. NPDC006326 TaxID=3156752 RepID=UPI0033B29DFF